MKKALSALMGATITTFEEVKSSLQGPRQPATQRSLGGTYEEMVSNWRHKMTESARNGDLLGAFLNLASFQGMLDDLYDNIVLPQIDVMQDFSSQDLQKNVKAYETGLGEYRKVYDAVPMKPAEYPTIEAFIKDYLAGKI